MQLTVIVFLNEGEVNCKCKCVHHDQHFNYGLSTRSVDKFIVALKGDIADQ